MPKIKTTKNIKRKTVKQPAKKKSVENKIVKKNIKNVYFEAVGRRKTSVARVRLFKKDEPKTRTSVLVNQKEFNTFFPTEELREIVLSPLKKTIGDNGVYISVKVKGGGIKSQAEAIKLGVSRTLLKVDPALRQILKPGGFLTRDARIKERRKFGLKKARKASQWRKR